MVSMMWRSITDWQCIFVDESMHRVDEEEKNEDQITGAKMTFKASVFCFWDDIKEAKRLC